MSYQHYTNERINIGCSCNGCKRRPYPDSHLLTDNEYIKKYLGDGMFINISDDSRFVFKKVDCRRELLGIKKRRKNKRGKHTYRKLIKKLSHKRRRNEYKKQIKQYKEGKIQDINLVLSGMEYTD